ncbi:PREDICTED: WAT1-related protein At1g43650-like [Ipomoea nil]|uniref:WAT1-related protein At1g43650-like n=1 Tax=Ipomoea nil TaxID=35883 RepID=UPI0009018C8C|nr:PREDICTED: WAT1-related protein At1g43650-like [Ipomoea nil]
MHDMMGIGKKHKAFGIMVIIQLTCTGMTLLSKAAISRGMKPSVFVAYRQAFAALALAPFAFFFERQNSAHLSCKLLCKICILSLCGINLSLNLFYMGLNYVSATFVTAATNTIPAMVFIIAICLRLERLAIEKSHGKAKVVGCVLSIIGAMVFTLYKGPTLYPPKAMQKSDLSANTTYSKQDWIRGSLLILGANLTWSLWLIMQAPIMKQYPAKLRLVTLQCSICCVMSTLWGAIKERDLSSWKLGWDINLLSVAYCGIVVTGISYWLQAWVVEKKGPVYASMFTPLALMLTAFFSVLFLNEILHLGSILGAALLVLGLYGFLWGKQKENKNMVVNQSKEVVELDTVSRTSADIQVAVVVAMDAPKT